MIILRILAWACVVGFFAFLYLCMLEVFNRDKNTVIVNLLFKCHIGTEMRAYGRRERFDIPLTLAELKDWAVKVVPWYFSDKIKEQGAGKILKVMVNDDESPFPDYLLNNGDYVEFDCA